jgi:hypothetical protein
MGPDATIIEKQLEFFRRGGAGCVFSTVAGKNPQSHGWHHFCVDAQKDEVGSAIASAINDADTSTLSLIFPALPKRVLRTKHSTPSVPMLWF